VTHRVLVTDKLAEEIMDAPKDMGAAQVVSEPVSEDVLQEATEAAANGVAAYSAFWTAASKEDLKKRRCLLWRFNLHISACCRGLFQIGCRRTRYATFLLLLYVQIWN